MRAGLAVVLELVHRHTAAFRALQTPGHESPRVIPDVLRFGAELDEDHIFTATASGGDETATCCHGVAGFHAVALRHGTEQHVGIFERDGAAI